MPTPCWETGQTEHCPIKIFGPYPVSFAIHTSSLPEKSFQPADLMLEVVSFVFPLDGLFLQNGETTLGGCVSNTERSLWQRRLTSMNCRLFFSCFSSACTCWLRSSVWLLCCSSVSRPFVSCSSSSLSRALSRLDNRLVSFSACRCKSILSWAKRSVSASRAWIKRRNNLKSGGCEVTVTMQIYVLVD